jgi:hypothetical protein
MRNMKTKNLLIYQGVPLLMVLLPFAWFGIVGNDIALKREAGIIENMTVIFLLVSIGFYISAFFKASKLGLSKNLKAWLVILIAGAAYFALEEISYGQHMFGWGTADTWKEFNDQGETNLHNVHPLFDQLPRLLLTLGILIGGVLMPLYRYFRKISLEESNRFYWQLPTIECLTIGLLVILIRPVLSIFEVDFINTGETKENFIALFIMLYSISIQTRLKHKAAD